MNGAIRIRRMQGKEPVSEGIDKFTAPGLRHPFKVREPGCTEPAAEPGAGRVYHLFWDELNPDRKKAGRFEPGLIFGGREKTVAERKVTKVPASLRLCKQGVKSVVDLCGIAFPAHLDNHPPAARKRPGNPGKDRAVIVHPVECSV